MGSDVVLPLPKYKMEKCPGHKTKSNAGIQNKNVYFNIKV